MRDGISAIGDWGETDGAGLAAAEEDDLPAGPLSFEEAEAWLASARPGATIEYARGWNATEAAAPKVAALFRQAAWDRVVLLTQRRLTADGRPGPAVAFSYLATRRARPLPDAPSAAPKPARRRAAERPSASPANGAGS